MATLVGTSTRRVQGLTRSDTGSFGDVAAMSLMSGKSLAVGECGMMTTDNVEIMIGRAEQLREKSVLALEIMAEQGSSVVFIDVRSLERPVSRGLGD